jgi:hypothetical protein
MSYKIGMSEQGANSLISVSGAGGLALGAWALGRGGMSAEQIGRKSVAFFFLTSLANVVGVIVFAALYAGAVLAHDPSPPVIYGFGAGALAATLFVLSLPRWLAGSPSSHPLERTRAVPRKRGGLLATRSGRA